MKNMSNFALFKVHSLMAAAWQMVLLLIPTLSELHSPFFKVHFGFCTAVMLPVVPPSLTVTQPWRIDLLRNFILKTTKTQTLERPAPKLFLT